MNVESIENTNFHFRPLARLVSTIGEDIIKDMHAAIVELVKNAYDADASIVKIIFDTFEYKHNDTENGVFENTIRRGIQITIEDNGHGMDYETVTKKWLVPSTDDKLKRRVSPKGRIMQGRKGIGRFASAILSDELVLKTYSGEELVSLNLSWCDFNENSYLDEIDVNISRIALNHKPSTVFIMKGYNHKYCLWNSNELGYLIKELRKTVTPVQKKKSDEEQLPFNITLELNIDWAQNFFGNNVEILELPLVEYYDYRIVGVVNGDGHADLIIENRILDEMSHFEIEKIELEPSQEYCGNIELDLRIFDRDPLAIENLVNMLNSNDRDSTFGKMEARRMLNEVSGVNLYRGGFRVRPYGDFDNDWLNLDKRRVQNPSFKIGSNQISGYITIDSEEKSLLKEKSARDGLKEDRHYKGLVKIVQEVLTMIELKRYSFRKKTGRGRRINILGSQLSEIIDSTKLSQEILSVIELESLSKDKVKAISKVIEKDTLAKQKIASEIQNMISIYQGQATLGKIMDVVLHESRKPLAWVKTQSSNIKRLFDAYETTLDILYLEKITLIIYQTKEQLDHLSDLLNRINPLASRMNADVSEFPISDLVRTCINVFEDEIRKSDIQLDIQMDESIKVLGCKRDYYTSITNIVENAVYWTKKSKDIPTIIVRVFVDGGDIIITISNNGPLILEDLLESGAIYDPGISTKENGTGLGLPIAGEAVDRNGGELTAINSKNGPMFMIKIKKEVI